ncbi:MAG TPA: tectonin domain-containing protein, partial [Thermoanaerobaculia bacterium]|nr:tectonin domain-containing protein [Thermoanaerobaculia bacterium]
LKTIAVGSATRVWGVNEAGEVFERTGSSWTKIDVGSLAAQVAIGADGTLAIRSRDNNAVIGPSLDRMKRMVSDRQVVDVSVGSRDQVYFIDGDGDLYRWGGETNKLIGPMGKFTRVSAASDGTVWAMNGQGDIFKLGSL